MRIGVVSDTHGWLDPFLLEAFAGAAAIIHAGDVGRPAVLDQLATVAPVLAVRGNIDGADLRHLPLSFTERVESGGRSLTVSSLHIAGNPFKPKKAAWELIARDEPALFVCGHSHIPVIRQLGETLWVNPGAAGRQGFHTERTAMRIEVDANGQLSLERIELGPRSRP